MDLLQDRTMGQSEGDKGQELLSLARGKRKRISVLKALFCAFLLIFLFTFPLKYAIIFVKL